MKRLFILIICFFLILMMGQIPGKSQSLTAGQLIQLIIKNTGVSPLTNTIDTVQAGDINIQVTGIITCMFGTMNVLRQAVEKGCNFIIVHETIFYNINKNSFNNPYLTQRALSQSAERMNLLETDPVYLEKSKFINDHHIVVWRCHDYIHRMKPDGIMLGMAAKLGWQAYSVNNSLSEYLFPEMTLREFLVKLKTPFPENAFYVVGNPEMKLTRVRFAPGGAGPRAHMRLLEDKNVDLVVAGEVPEVETYEYMRDALALGRNKAIIIIGHGMTEENGMDYCRQWLQTFIPDLPIYFIRDCPSFKSF